MARGATFKSESCTSFQKVTTQPCACFNITDFCKQLELEHDIKAETYPFFFDMHPHLPPGESSCSSVWPTQLLCGAQAVTQTLGRTGYVTCGS